MFDIPFYRPDDRDFLAGLQTLICQLEELDGRDCNDPIDPWCLSCPPIFKEIDQIVQEYTQAYDNGLVSGREYLNSLLEMSRGASIQGEGAEILNISLNAKDNSITLSVDVSNTDEVIIAVQGALLDATADGEIANLDVLVNGDETLVLEQQGAGYRILQIPVEPGTSDIQLIGTQLGPHAEPQLDNRNETILKKTDQPIIDMLVLITIGIVTLIVVIASYSWRRTRVIASNRIE